MISRSWCAKVRRERAEEQGKLSISHYLGDLHCHTRTDISEPTLPDDITQYRQGSNCGKVPLFALIKYHEEELANEFIGITNHSREASLKACVEGCTKWFMNMYLANNQWLKDNFGKDQRSLSITELDKIQELSLQKAKEIAFYGDERIFQVFAEIKTIAKKAGIKIFKGIEASLTPEGEFDTPLVEQGVFDMVNCSIHIHDRELFASVIEDPQEYTRLVLKGITHAKTNIMAHIGYGLDKEFADKLDWDLIAQAAIKNFVAIEVNIIKVIWFIYTEILDYKKFPQGDKTYKKVFQEKLSELVPLLPSKKIGNTLAKYFSQGLKIAINTDEHRNDFIKAITTKQGTQFSFIRRSSRYWRALKMLEAYLNNIFARLGVRKENIINTYTAEELERFFKKNKNP